MLEKGKLVDGESQDSRNVFGGDELGWCVRFRDEGHVLRKAM